MKRITKKMIKIYRLKHIGVDFMGYSLQRGGMATFHHIIKKEHGGSETISNGAVLMGETSHPYLHLIESKDLDIYIYISKILKEINKQGIYPSKKQLLAINDVLKGFEREYSGSTNRKGKILIKERYIERVSVDKIWK